MRSCIWALVIAFLLVPAVVAAPPQQGQGKAGEPAWAYGFPAPPKPEETGPARPANPPAPPDDVVQKHVPGSTLAFTQKQISDGFGPADWFPGEHPQMTDVVAHGRKPDIRACGLCHYPNGKGRPENSSPAGLPYAYIVQTMEDFKNGLRKSTDPRKANTNAMGGFAKAMTDDEIKATAQYFSSMKWTPWIKVVETDTVPKTHINAGLFIAEEGNEKEPIAGRIIEVPVNAEASESLRDPHSGFIAYVPAGSIKKGEALVTTGSNGKTIQCGACHGEDLQGLGPVPGIAGRSASYLMRQLYDMQQGSRNGVWTPLMKPVLAKLNNDELTAIVAYVASRPVAATSSMPAPTSAADAAPLIEQGKARFKAYGCVDCHGANGEGTDDAPDLVGTHLDAAGIAKFLNKPSADARAKGMPDIPPTSADLQPLVAYVVSLKRPAAQ